MRKIRIFKLLTANCSLFFILCSLLPAPSLHSLSFDETLTELEFISPGTIPEFQWDPLFQDGVFNMGDHSGAFFTAEKEGETGFLLFDNRELFTVPLPYHDNGKLVFPEAFVVTLKDVFTRSFENDASRFRIAAIMIDPGHGGRDPGAIGKPVVNGKTMQVAEKDIVLKVAKNLKSLLSAAYPDKRILMTRETDVFISLEQRADMANAVTIKDNEAVIFISIHANWAGNPNARGYEVWHINSNYRRTLLDPSKYDYSEDIMMILNAMEEESTLTESIILADSLLQGLGQALGKSVPSRGRKANDWFVVKNSRMPAVLVELGFVSNPQDAVIMTGGEGLQKLTESLYKGIESYINIFERP
ncbi:MAG: N-acetylmuramoyl-L-alanine amidase [Treponema sp.]|jgi:N-acetylmuramoyl-L-alanine amidase|nr:N-acetylmuramoyl-L-alanine amidase [Treponema sp.]